MSPWGRGVDQGELDVCTAQLPTISFLFVINFTAFCCGIYPSCVAIDIFPVGYQIYAMIFLLLIFIFSN
jgi:hypothetical protein